MAGIIVGIIAVLLFSGITLNTVGNYVADFHGSGNGYIFAAGLIIAIVVILFILKTASK